MQRLMFLKRYFITIQIFEYRAKQQRKKTFYYLDQFIQQGTTHN